MAAASSFAIPNSSSTFAPATTSPTLTHWEFNLFHTIDRVLFTRLTLGLGREQGQSMQIVALLIWLEQTSQARNLVANLVPLPDTLLNSIADEACMILNCVENETYAPSPLKNNKTSSNSLNDEGIPLIQAMTRRGLSLKFFHDNRLAVLQGVTKNVNEVCVRAFRDIVLRTPYLTFQDLHRQNRYDKEDDMTMMMKKHVMNYYGPVMSSPVFPYGYYYDNEHRQRTMSSTGGAGLYGFNNSNSHVGTMMMMDSSGILHEDQFFSRGNGDLGLNMMSLKGYELDAMKELVNTEIGDALNRIKIKVNNEEEEEEEENEEQEDHQLPQDDRTIFLTFSKGYPTSEDEVREFFTRNFGECIETIAMQEVGEESQPLYARLVLESATRIEEVLDGEPKRKFCINGKHVWARKFVRKASKPSSSSTSTVLSQSPTQPAV